MRIGRLRDLISIYNPPADGIGTEFSSSTWTKVEDARAEIIEVGANESQIVNGGRQFTTSMQILVRSTTTLREGISSASAIVHGSKIYYVENFRHEDSKRTRLLILATERRAGA